MNTNPFLRGTSGRAPQGAPARPQQDVAQPKALGSSDLTAIRAHYLKKTLVSLELQHELRLLMRRDALAMLGPPFRGSKYGSSKLLMLRHSLHRFVLTFPFLASAPPDFFPNKVQVFLERLLERKMVVVDEEEGDTTATTTLLRKLERYLCLLISSGIHLKNTKEEVVRISERDRMRIATLEAQRKATNGAGINIADTQLDVNIVSVRSAMGKGRLRNKAHDEFILCTRAGAEQQVYVARRYNEIAKLHVALRTKFSDLDIPGPPAKDRTTMTTSDASGDLSLARERNRLTLRAYIRSLLAIPEVSDSETMRDFLLADPIELSPAEERDAAARRHADQIRLEQREQFAKETAARARQLHEHIGAFKADLLQPDGLSLLFATIRRSPHIQQLPEKYQLIVEWAKSSMASGLYSMFVGKDSASQNFAQLKYIHSMVPYFMVRSILRISNPMAMMRSLLDLFLAQPFGQKSLLQRMFTNQIHEEMNEMREMNKRVQARIGDAHLARKVDEFIAMPYAVQRTYIGRAEDERVDILTIVMRSPLGGDLEQMQVHRIVTASRAYAALKRERRAALARGEPEPEPDNDDAWLYEDLHVYMNLARKIRDKEQLIDLIYDPATTDLLKDIITIFYAPLAQVYKAANIADTLSDVQVFITDLIKTVEEHEQLSLAEPHKMVQVFVNLVQRHEQLFYHFIYQVHTQGSDLFDRLVRWIELFVNYVRDPAENAPSAHGLGVMDLEMCLPAGSAERARVMQEVDQVIHHAYQRKLKRELKVQQRLARQAVIKAGDEPEEPAGASGDPLAEALSEQFGFSSMFGQVADVEAEESGSDSEDEVLSDSDSDEGPEDADHFRHRRSAPPPTEKAAPGGAPSTDAIRALLPVFMEMVRSPFHSPSSGRAYWIPPAGHGSLYRSSLYRHLLAIGFKGQFIYQPIGGSLKCIYGFFSPSPSELALPESFWARLS